MLRRKSSRLRTQNWELLFYTGCLGIRDKVQEWKHFQLKHGIYFPRLTESYPIRSRRAAEVTQDSPSFMISPQPKLSLKSRRETNETACFKVSGVERDIFVLKQYFIDRPYQAI